MAETHLSADVGLPSTVDELLLPEHPSQYGPETRRLLIRTATMLLGIFALGAWLTFAHDDPALRAAGLSMIFPGGGFLYVAWPSLFVATLVAMAFAVLLWWGLSAFFLIPLVWLISVVGIASLGGAHVWDWAIPLVISMTAATLGTMLFRSRAQHRRKVTSIPAMNEYLKSTLAPQASHPSLEPNSLDRELLAWCYELALQPPDEFEGFD